MCSNRIFLPLVLLVSSLSIPALADVKFSKQSIYNYLAEATTPLLDVTKPSFETPGADLQFVRQNDYEVSSGSVLYTEGLTICVGVGLINKTTGRAMLIHADIRTDIEALIRKFYRNEVGTEDNVIAALVGGHSSFKPSRSAIYRSYALLSELGVSEVFHRFNGRVNASGKVLSNGSQNLILDPSRQSFSLY